MHDFRSLSIFSFCFRLFLQVSIKEFQLIVQPHSDIQINSQFYGNLAWQNEVICVALFTVTAQHSINKFLLNASFMLESVKIVGKNFLATM